MPNEKQNPSTQMIEHPAVYYCRGCGKPLPEGTKASFHADSDRFRDLAQLPDGWRQRRLGCTEKIEGPKTERYSFLTWTGLLMEGVRALEARERVTRKFHIQASEHPSAERCIEFCRITW